MDVTINIDLGSGFESQIESYLSSIEKFKPLEVSNNCEHAIYVEYGSNPARKWGGPTSKARDNIREWAAVKLRNPGAWFAIYQKIMREGLAPKPFFRPACNVVGDNPQMYAYMDGDFSMMNLALEIVMKSQHNLVMSGTNYKYEVYSSFEIKQV